MMKTLVLIFIFGLCGGKALSAGETPIDKKNRVLRDLKIAYAKQDDLTMRILIKALPEHKLTMNDWIFVRKILHSRTSVGFDLVFKWEFARPVDWDKNSKEGRLNSLLSSADSAMLSEDFDKAFRYYQLIAKQLKKEISKNRKDNYWLYAHSVHQMARALYGAGRYRDALQVYGWIGKDYFRFRQTLFEKMWAAFRANRLDLALGAIASQQSSYFSDYLEPESYLVQVYILKKLCRDEELNTARSLVKQIRAKLDPRKNSYELDAWVKSDIELLNLHNLTKVKVRDDDPYKNRKRLEQTRIKEIISKKFEGAKERLYKQMDLILAFSNLSVAMDNTRINTDVVPNRSSLSKISKEFWPADSAEDWVDELGGHMYIGESQCSKSKI
jgi:hypothetical protein